MEAEPSTFTVDRCVAAVATLEDRLAVCRRDAGTTILDANQGEIAGASHDHVDLGVRRVAVRVGQQCMNDLRDIGRSADGTHVGRDVPRNDPPRRNADGQHRLEYVAEPERLGFGFRRPVVDEGTEASDLGHERARQHFSGRVVVHGLEREDPALERGDGGPHLVQRVGEPFLGLIALDAATGTPLPAAAPPLRAAEGSIRTRQRPSPPDAATKRRRRATDP